jgi:uncharacterized protein YebE (UPF0316 family)
VGSVLETKMAIGTIMVRIVPKKTCDEELANKLRSMGFGVTIIEGIGKNGPVCLLDTTLNRKELPVLMEFLKKTDAEAFVTVSDARETRGGYITRVKKK